MNWNLVNKLRPHNKNETTKHFMIKSMVFKILFNNGYWVYSEHDIIRRKDGACTDKIRIADIAAYEKHNSSTLKIIVEVETKPTKKHNKELMEFYENETLYIIDVREISDNLIEMEKQIKHILGM